MATLYGDTPFTLSGFQRGGAQSLRGDSDTGSVPTDIDNNLFGDAQAMENFARGGDDTLIGGSGELVDNDLFGDANVMLDFTRGGDDLLIAGQAGRGGGNTLRGDALEMSDFARGGDDIFLTEDAVRGAVSIGDADRMTDFARGGDDVLFAGVGGAPQVASTLYGDAIEMSGHARGGNDVLLNENPGGEEISYFGDARTLSGDAIGGNDTIRGAEGSQYQILHGDGDVLRDNAVGGDDVIVSADNSFDLMWGDATSIQDNARGGNDRFVFASDSGQDQIYDFEQGKDVIDLTGYAADGIHALADLTIVPGSLIPNYPSPSGSTIELTGDNLIVVHNVETFSPDDFLFA